MTIDEAIENLKELLDCNYVDSFEDAENEALEMAIKALENISHLTGRPCDVCEYHGECGCSKWECVFRR